MGQCLPGMPCYETIVYTTYPKGCVTTESSPFTLPLSSDNVVYTGPNLPYTGIQTDTNLTEALQRIDAKLNPTVIFDLLMSAIDNNPSLKTLLCSKIGECP